MVPSCTLNKEEEKSHTEEVAHCVPMGNIPTDTMCVEMGEDQREHKGGSRIPSSGLLPFFTVWPFVNCLVSAFTKQEDTIQWPQGVQSAYNVNRDVHG